ncbi:MAG: M15 family metallopeptidase, partial [Vicinamibacterales bacterium]
MLSCASPLVEFAVNCDSPASKTTVGPPFSPLLRMWSRRPPTSTRRPGAAGRTTPAGAIAGVDLQGLEMLTDFPVLETGRVVRRLPLMAQLRPVYEALFRTIRELGWNDLLFETGGGACFRGIKHPGAARITINGAQVVVDPFSAPNATTVVRINTLFTPQQRARVVAAARTARTISEHGLGAAIDFNVSENGQAIPTRPFGSMDPRIVALFEAFHFRFGGCFTTTDPMHFEYCVAPCAPAAATTGPLPPVATPRMLMPRAAGRVLV